MNKPTIITTPNGDRMAILPLADYESLVEAAEDVADIQTYDQIKQKITAGEEELIPVAVVNRILDGENKIRVWREHRGISARDLAEKTEISAGYLSQIETGTRDGSFDTIKRIAAALNVSVDDLV
ncbi:putative transcriptional regulator [Mesorhizobium australicum WSM2073]|uniref:Putative transcriptional regulator n=1 Tax=Mesorhizobium australicum (strain HAMBI 3006 / LMG 24608 / WSM2073) TaxID=754035 RepID=L0KH15_MESAW|nr:MULTISPECIES: helix-turn-helix transcriptional regulator [Mesorhizobium]AGB44632.1 putative transcriptional regulator [Mesorhizobium australicum WSM2073]MBZ9682615.1 helix-turn-helix domain-containing protein [Mesorhizobium sp. CO1-1-2]MBZ9923966.1 helix-turn-helix domain-containing protein [Mesorhizobium sp. BR1-1-4]